MGVKKISGKRNNQLVKYCKIRLNKEKLFFVINKETNNNLFVYIHFTQAFNGRVFLFLNPIFDEKKRVQTFQANTARELVKIGFHVCRFDYYGTGDSGGHLYEFDFLKCQKDIQFICEYLINNYSVKEIILLGIRIGADIALRIAGTSKFINEIVLIEPIISGKRYLTEQRIRNEAFYKINDIRNIEKQIVIHGKKYEDYLGYPFSDLNINYLLNLNSELLNISEKRIFLIKLDCFYSKRIIERLREKLHANNQLTFETIHCPDFWASLENINTQKITSFIINSYNRNV